jgi:hypothetical protein
MKSKLKNRLQEYHHQKEKEMISGVEIPDIGYTNSIGFAEIFQNKKKVITSVISTSQSLQMSNFVTLILWTSRDQISFDSSQKPIGCLMSVATRTSTTKIPQVQSQHHYMVPLKNWTETQNKIGGCYLVHFLVSYYSKISRAPTIQQVFSSE